MKNSTVVKFHKSSFVLFCHIAFVLLFIGIIDIIALMIIDFKTFNSINISGFVSHEEYFFFFSLIIQFIMITYIFLLWGTSYYYIEERIIYYKKGIIFKQINHFNINLIERVYTKETFFGKLFDYGDIILESSNRNTRMRYLSNTGYILSLIDNDINK